MQGIAHAAAMEPRFDSVYFLSAEFSARYLNSVSDFEVAFNNTLKETHACKSAGILILDLDSLCGPVSRSTTSNSLQPIHGKEGEFQEMRNEQSHFQLLHEGRFRIMVGAIQTVLRFQSDKTCAKLMVFAAGNPTLIQSFFAEVLRCEKSELAGLMEPPRWKVAPTLLDKMVILDNTILRRHTVMNNWGANAKSNIPFDPQSDQLF